MARDDPQFRIRLPADLKAWVENAAKKSNRSLNAEIVQRLEGSRFGGLAADVPASEGLNSDERALIEAWRDISDENRSALRVAIRNARIAAERDAS